MDTLNNRVEDCGEGAKGESSEEEDGPPADDCCPICFGDFTIPCKANCGHWYCGSCILQFWNYSSASRPCKCPMCSRYIRRLTPEASLCHRQEHEITEVLKNVLRYNRLFVGGTRGLLQKMFLSVVYAATPLNFIPTGNFGIVRVFDYAAIALVVILRLIGIYRRRRLNQRVRRLAATQPEPANE